ncbi:MAG TPA: type II secretion system secretin GspD [Casimicrobiaceae bacterium]|nr:type II secretion system secretin GspD [Casimicrobiaceae bacterium]
MRRWFRSLLAVALLLNAVAAFAQDSDTVTLNFVNADIDAVVKAVGEITGRNFLVDPRVKGTVNIVSARPVAKALVYPTLLSALRMQGFAAVESDGVVKIVPEADAKTQAGPVQRATVSASGDRIVTQVIALRYESAAQLVTVLRPLISPNNTIAAYIPNNAIIITDYADNLKRIDRIVATLDQPPTGEPILVPVKNASALDVVTLVNRVLTENAGQPGTPVEAQQRVALVADPRSNSILVRADNPARSARVRQLIEQLDTPGRAGSNVFIVYLKNAEAAQVADMLRGLYGGGERSASPFAPVPASAGAPAAMPNAVTTTTTSFGASTAATSPLVASAATGAPMAFAAGGAMVEADVANNALVIMAPEAVYNNLRAVIDRLDTRRAQVFVEALIVEVSSDKAAEFGIQWQVLTGANKNNVQGIGGTNFGARGSGQNIIDASVNLGSLGQGLNLGVINGTVSIPGLGVISNLGLLVRALENDTTANILSTPTLLTLDNEEARIIVGENVPFITGQYATTGATTTIQPFQTIERRDVGLVLRVRPQITEGGTVRLGVYEEVSRVEDNSAAGPLLSKRALETSVVVDDQQIVVLGGLIQDTMNDGTQKLPYAGDVPFFGSLFRYDNRSRVKTNLMIFLKPTIVRGTSGGHDITTERYDYLRGEQLKTTLDPRWFWKDPTAPVLPPQGTMPGTPQATPIGQPEPGNR